MADLDTELVVSSGLSATENAATAAGDTFEYGSIVRVFNGDASPITVTMVTPQVEDGDLEVEDREITITNGEAQYIKATDRAYLDTETGRVTLTYSSDTNVTVEVIR